MRIKYEATSYQFEKYALSIIYGPIWHTNVTDEGKYNTGMWKEAKIPVHWIWCCEDKIIQHDHTTINLKWKLDLNKDTKAMLEMWESKILIKIYAGRVDNGVWARRNNRELMELCA